MRSSKESKTKQRQGKKRPKWDKNSNSLFFKLYNHYSGDLSMITKFFMEETEYKFEQK